MKRVVSGAQTGVDRAALDVALELGLRCGGWVPHGRLDEDGRIPSRYPNLRETGTSEWNERTEANVRDSDGTLLISRGPLTGGSAHTADTAARLGKPHLHLDLDELPEARAAAFAEAWVAANDIDTLNVAGPRASKDPGLYDRAVRVLRLLLS